DGGGRVLRQKIAELEVGIHTGKSTTQIVDGEQCRHRLQFADGSSLEADIVVFSAGIRPRDELARACGLSVGERGGIAIDDRCRTPAPNTTATGVQPLSSGA